MWIADRNYALSRECVELRSHVTPDGDPDSAEPGLNRATELMAQAFHGKTASEADRAIADARGRALHEYRDETTRAGDDVGTISAAEGWAHRTYRRVFRKPVPTLAAPAKAAPILAAWRKPSAMSSSAMTWPDDATARTLQGAIESMPVTAP